MSWWVHDLWARGEHIVLISWIFWVIFSITLHELAHGWVAIWQGDRTPIELDRMTGNPLVHMGPQSLLVFALCGIAWGMMPVNPHRFRNRRWGDVLVSAAGPAMNVLIAVVALVALTLWVRFGPSGSNLYANLATFLFHGVSLNLILTALNLLPIPPLDGSRIVAGFSWRMRQLFDHPQAMMVGMILFIVVFFMSPLGSIFFALARGIALVAIEVAGMLVGNPPIYEIIA